MRNGRFSSGTWGNRRVALKEMSVLLGGEGGVLAIY